MKKYPAHLHCVIICCFFSYVTLTTAAEQNVQVSSTDYAAISKSTDAVNENQMPWAERIPELEESISSMERRITLKEVLIPIDKFLKLFNKKCFALPRALRKQLGKDDAQAAIARMLANESQNNQISGSNVTRKLIEQIVKEGANAVGYSQLTAEDTASLQTVYGNIVLQIASKQQKDLAQQKKERRKQQKELERQEMKEKIKRKFAKIGISAKTEKTHSKAKTLTPKSNTKRLAQSYEDSGTIIAPADAKSHKWKETIKKVKKKKSNDNERA